MAQERTPKDIVLDHLEAVQTTLAVYTADDADPAQCLSILNSLLDCPDLLRAMVELRGNDHVIELDREPNGRTTVTG